VKNNNDALRARILRILATAAIASTSANAHAADAAAAPAAPAADQAASSADNALEEVVVTAAAGDKTRIRSSISVTDLSTQAVQDFTPRSEGSVLRMIPGIQIGDTAGPGGNSNIGVRGIPVSTGGSEYVQLQEDGLPVVLFGDIQFGNNDYWIRFDQNVERVEAVRGGSASTFASQAPGAIINYVSKTGETTGGSIGITRGTNYRETRLDFDYGGHISDTVRFHVGGFMKDGNGPTNSDYNSATGYQIKGNITKDLADGKGFIRLNFKRLDDKEPTNTSMPILATLSNGNVTGFGQIPGLDPRYFSSDGIYNQQFKVLGQNGGFQLVNSEGIHPVATAVGGQFHYDFEHNVSVDDNFRYTIMSGIFGHQFTGELLTSGPTGVLGSTVNGGTVGSIVYAAGPLVGQNYTDPYLSNSAQAYTTMSNVGSTVNDLSFTGKYDWTSDISSSVKLGWFHDRQSIASDWRINNLYQSLNSTANSAPLDLFTGPNGTGTQLTANGLTGYNNQWGGCCGGRTYDLTYTNDAVYLDFDTKIGKLDIDPSIRIDTVRGNGSSYAPVSTGTVTQTDAVTPKSGTGAVLPTLNTGNTTADILDYGKRYTSWSVGALYSFTNDTSVFARASRGGRFNADRMLFGGDFNADGSLSQHGNAVALNFLTQQELGVKNRGDIGDARYTVEGTFFHTKLTENNYDFTLLSKNPPQDPNISATYRGQGVEFTGSLSWRGFAVVTDVTYADSKITSNPGNTATEGKEPHALPKILYRVSPMYDHGLFAVGLSITGHSSSYADDANSVKLPAGDPLVSFFAKVRPLDNLEVGLNVSNLFNTIATAGGGSIQQTISPTLGILDGSIPYGRLVDVSVRYKF
jgi:outer membrane receptor protein involved in Fe transport